MGKPKLRVYFLTTMNSGIAFYRQWQFKEAFNRWGFASGVMPWFNSAQYHVQEWQWRVHDDPRVYARTGLINGLVRQSDVVVVQYLHTWESLALVEALKACHPKVVFLTEIDDDILNTPAPHRAFSAYRPVPEGGFRQIVVEQLKALDGVIVSTPALADQYREFNKHVHVVPNALDTDLWDDARRPLPGGPLRVGWAGAADHGEDLKTIEEPIKRWLAGRKDAEFHIMHSCPDFFRNQSRVVWHKDWKPITKYPKALARLGFAIGMAPLVDNAFNRSKSNLRALEYAGLKIPFVAARVGHFEETLAQSHKKGGFLYSSPDEVPGLLDTLVGNPRLREEMGKYHYLDIKDRFGLKPVAARYAELLEECHQRGQTTKVDVTDPRERGSHKWITRPQGT